LTSTYTWDVTVQNVNRPPSITINNPPPDGTYMKGAEIIFNARQTEDPDESSYNLTYSWRSDRQGILMQGKGPAGAQFSSNRLVSGTHRITLTVEDSDGGRSTANFTLTIKEQAPAKSLISSAWLKPIAGITIAVIAFAAVAALAIKRRRPAKQPQASQQVQSIQYQPSLATAAQGQNGEYAAFPQPIQQDYPPPIPSYQPAKDEYPPLMPAYEPAQPEYPSSAPFPQPVMAEYPPPIASPQTEQPDYLQPIPPPQPFNEEGPPAPTTMASPERQENAVAVEWSEPSEMKAIPAPPETEAKEPSVEAPKAESSPQMTRMKLIVCRKCKNVVVAGVICSKCGAMLK